MSSPPFARVPTRAIFDENLGHAELRVLAALATHADGNGSCWPSVRILAKRLGHKNRRVVQRQIRKLQLLGYLVMNNQFDERGAQIASQFHLPDLHKGGRSGRPPGDGRDDHRGDDLEGARGDGRGDHPNRPIEQTNKTSISEAALFERFWAAYPNRKPHPHPKKPARDKFLAVLKGGGDVEAIIRGAENYAVYIRQEGKEPKWIASATKFLNQEYWTDYQARPKPNGGVVL